jgi:hypothetical protein
MTTYTFDTPGHLVVRIDDRSGEIDLATHDRPTTEIEITPLEDAATDQVGRTRVEHRETDGRHRIEIEVPSAARNGGLVRRMLAGSTSVRVAVRLPVGADLEVTAASASTRATGRFGAVHIESASGSVGVDDVDGDVEVRTASGSVRVGTVLGSTTIRTASGEVRCGRIAVNSISTASGAVRVDAVTGRLKVKTSSGSVRAGDVTDGCTIQTVSGSQLVERLPVRQCLGRRDGPGRPGHGRQGRCGDRLRSSRIGDRPGRGRRRPRRRRPSAQPPCPNRQRRGAAGAGPHLRAGRSGAGAPPADEEPVEHAVVGGGLVLTVEALEGGGVVGGLGRRIGRSHGP